MIQQQLNVRSKSDDLSCQEADRLAAQALGHVYATMLAYNESQTASEQAISHQALSEGNLVDPIV